jgi:exodeoxyribonuclease VII large subunit
VRAQQRLNHLLSVWRVKVEGRALQLGSLDPKAVLERGYSICWAENDAVIKSVGQVAPGDAVTVQVSDGAFHTKVEG